MAEHNEKGAKSEIMAREFLTEKGYTIRHTNWRYAHEEIDIIAEKDHHLVVVEVKACLAEYYSSPSELLSVKKMKHLTNAAEAYIIKYEVQFGVRFDLIIIIFTKTEGIRIEHYESAFIPGVNW
jgi:putative endonuclease